MTPKDPKKRAAAGPQPEREKPLPRVWSVVFYSEQEVQLAALALAALEMGIVMSSDHPLDVLTQVGLQEVAINSSHDLIAQNGGRDWVKGVRHRFTELVRSIDAELRPKGGAHAP